MSSNRFSGNGDRTGSQLPRDNSKSTPTLRELRERREQKKIRIAPKVAPYGNSPDGKRKHASTNAMSLEIGPLKVWYSYEVPVACRVGGKRATTFILGSYSGKVTEKHKVAIQLEVSGDHPNWPTESRPSFEIVDSDEFWNVWSDRVTPLIDAMEALQ